MPAQWTPVEIQKILIKIAKYEAAKCLRIFANGHYRRNHHSTGVTINKDFQTPVTGCLKFLKLYISERHPQH
ncbi:hypothetical protein ACTXT7_001870 [Hymenolepis weldensis]